MSELSSLNLVLAKFDLAVVQMITGAMRAADTASSAHLGGSGAPGGIRPRDVFTPTPRFESRVIYHPTPRFESRPVLHPQARIELKDRCQAPNQPEHAHITPSPVKPVWKTLPDVTPPAPAPQVKANIVRPDIRHKGTLIDTFI